MIFSDQTLMAYVDGELDAATRRVLEAAMKDDGELAQRIARQQALRSELSAAFGDILDEPVPTRLMEAARYSPAGASSRVVDLATTRTAKARRAPLGTWPQWASIAASLLIGVLAGRFTSQEQAQSTVLATRGNRLVATGALADALLDQPGGARGGAAGIDIGLSFRAKSGEYCRTFTLHRPGAVAGFACRAASEWQVRAVTQTDLGMDGGGYRMAGTPLPPLILQAVQATIEGDALDAEQEAAARRRGWQP